MFSASLSTCDSRTFNNSKLLIVETMLEILHGYKYHQYTNNTTSNRIMPVQVSFILLSLTDFTFTLPNIRRRLRLLVPRLMNTHVLQGGPPTRRPPGFSRRMSRTMAMKPSLSTEAKYGLYLIRQGSSHHGSSTPKKILQ